MEKKNEGLRGIFDDVRQRNASLLKDKQQLETCSPRLWEENTELPVFYNTAKDKNTEIEDKKQEYINKNAEQNPSNGEQKTFQRLYNQLQHTNTEMEEEKQQ